MWKTQRHHSPVHLHSSLFVNLSAAINWLVEQGNSYVSSWWSLTLRSVFVWRGHILRDSKLCGVSTAEQCARTLVYFHTCGTLDFVVEAATTTNKYLHNLLQQSVANISGKEYTYLVTIIAMSLAIPHPGGGAVGAIAPLKPTKVTLFTMIFYNTENNIRDISPFCSPLFCHSSVVKYTSYLLQ